MDTTAFYQQQRNELVHFTTRITQCLDTAEAVVEGKKGLSFGNVTVLMAVSLERSSNILL
jgi:hypothetical protein